MRRITFWLITALLTFTIGVLASTLWIQSYYSNGVTPVKTGKIDPRWVYINQDLQWKSPPKDVTGEFNLNYKYSEDVTLLVFDPNNQFASIHCTIYQADETSQIQIIPNEGYLAYKGTWKLDDGGTITITSRLTSSDKQTDSFVAEQKKERVEQLIIHQRAYDRFAEELELNGKIFLPSPNIKGISELLSIPDDNP